MTQAADRLYQGGFIDFPLSDSSRTHIEDQHDSTLWLTRLDPTVQYNITLLAVFHTPFPNNGTPTLQLWGVTFYTYEGYVDRR